MWYMGRMEYGASLLILASRQHQPVGPTSQSCNKNENEVRSGEGNLRRIPARERSNPKMQPKYREVAEIGK